MTACFKLMRTLQQRPTPDPENLCEPCVYFSRNLDAAECPISETKTEHCGLDFTPGGVGCTEMRTDNCSTRKGKS